jgi:hypothetical protein
MKTYEVLGLLISIFSAVFLVMHSFSMGVSSSLHLLLDYYEHGMHVVFGWTEPWITLVLERLREYFYWDLKLYPHWKHILVLLMLFFGAEARSLTEVRSPPWAVLQWIVGLIIAVIASIAAGTFAMDYVRSDLALNFQLAAIPLFAISLFLFTACAMLASSSTLKRTWWKRFLDNETRLNLALFTLAISIALTLASLFTPGQSSPVPGLGFGLVALTVVAIALIYLGISNAQNSPRFGIIGRAIFGVLGGTLLFLIGNAGLVLAGM